MIHELKTWPGSFALVNNEVKTHEIRKQDRPFATNDNLWLREFDPQTSQYTGKSTLVRVTHISNGGEWGLPADLCVMSIRRIRSWGRRGCECPIPDYSTIACDSMFIRCNAALRANT
jgi:hypothetical protein